MGCCSSISVESSGTAPNVTCVVADTSEHFSEPCKELGPTNINRASVDDLVLLPGIGQRRARAIVAYRTEHGPFASFDDLTAVPGIGSSVIFQLSGQISFDMVAVVPPPPGKHAVPSKPAVAGKARHEPFFFPDSEEAAGINRLLETLSCARNQLDLAVFSIGHHSLASALIHAQQRGVVLRVVTDDIQSKASHSAVARLKDAGIQVRTDASEKYHMHHKFAIVDGALLVSGSLNWTHCAAKRNNENIIVSSSSYLCQCFSTEFNRLWTAFASGSVALAPPASFDGDVAALFFPEPSGTNFNLIRRELEKARRSIYVAVFTLTHDALSDLLMKRHSEGLDVRIITDNRQASCSGADAYRLREAGLQVRTDRSPAAMHHKFAVVDGTTLINGSFNWTAQAANGNQEDALIIRNAGALATGFISEFEHLWSKFGDAP